MMLRNQNKNMLSQFNQFRNELQKSGKNPEQVLNELVSSGKVTKAQLDRASEMARMFSWLIK